ncbi:MAG: hypothetical protein KGZ96_01640 [Clostridia bacterium]|nr:hypothetical protein [Clostridia bacterium]
MTVVARKSTWTLIVILALTFVLVAPSTALAQPLKANDLFVSIWPEYDEPGVLVIYSGEVRNTSAEPFEGRIVLNIPKGVARAEMVCETEQGMLCLPFEIKQMENYAQLSWIVSKPIQSGGVLPFMAEFYYNPFGGDKNKSFTYEFIPSFDIDRIIFEVKEPFNAVDFKIEPAFDSVREDNFGFSTYRQTLFNLAQGESRAIFISYTRESNEPSIDRALVTGPGVNQPNLGGGQQSMNSTTGILLVAFLGLMGFFLFYAINSANHGNKSDAKETGKGKKKVNSVRDSKSSEDEKKKLRRLLLGGKISEETYKELVAELENSR